jgi:hypothetical protein
MKEQHNQHILPPAYEGVERQLLATFYSGVYLTNADMIEVGKRIGLELAYKDRTALLKELMHHAHETNQKSELMQAFVQILQLRADTYRKLVKNFPATAPILEEMIHKARSTAMLLQREMRSHPYE